MKRWIIAGLLIGLGLGTGCTKKPGKVGEGCDLEKRCEDGLRCVEAKCCQPNCEGKLCGDDGCGGSCGTCEGAATCQEGKCKCTPKCEGKACGDDGCGGGCGNCQADQACKEGKCECAGQVCKGKCCPAGQVCNKKGACCDPKCGSKTCGPDACGGQCGKCAEGEKCVKNQCKGKPGKKKALKGKMGDAGDVSDEEIPLEASRKTKTASASDVRPSRQKGDSSAQDEVSIIEEAPAAEPTQVARNEVLPLEASGPKACATPCKGNQVCDPSGLCVPKRKSMWVTLNPGEFLMGSSGDDTNREADEINHRVKLSRGFSILSTEVTQAEFKQAMGYNPSHFNSCEHCPVEGVSWSESAAYCNALSSRNGIAKCYACSGSGAAVQCTLKPDYPNPYDCPGYRLPTEAEWEYAALAGRDAREYRHSLDAKNNRCPKSHPVLDSIAWFCGNSDAMTHTVGAKEPNAWGLHDMLGNVPEWVHDYYAQYPTSEVTDPAGPAKGTARAVRGGGWNFGAWGTRPPYRSVYVSRQDTDVGFRPARTNL